MSKFLEFPVIDGHIDTLMSIDKRNFHERSDLGHCDLPRMREGGVNSALFAIYPARTRKNIIQGLDKWLKLVYHSQNELYHIKSIQDFKTVRSKDKIGAILHFEGAGGIDKDLQLLRISYHIGLRTIGLCHANKNKFASGVLFQDRQYETGLSELGRNLVLEAQRLGITIDASHLNDPSFWDLMEVTTRPIIASHSNSRKIANHLRNLTDDQLKAIQEVHGTVGINFGSMFLKNVNPKQQENDLTLNDIKTHIDHIVNVTDINTVAIGTDYDGAKVPNCMKDASYFPKLWQFLLENGYSKGDLAKISHNNLLRVFNDTWKS
ncbi:MAG: membrane dipeptidase [Candidatus Lokiarchaeota archaeon]|nr:membrane dipeptidase [Candidatus Lokiarchaeota archaeon]